MILPLCSSSFFLGIYLYISQRIGHHHVNSTQRKKTLPSNIVFHRCDCLYLKKKNEAERHLRLDGKSPYQVSAQQLKMQLNSLRRLLLFLLFTFLSQGFLCVAPTRSLTSSLTFPPFRVISSNDSSPPFSSSKTTSFFRR